MDLSISRMIIVPVMANNYRYYFHSGLLLTGNGCIYIMVALADWYILPILPPIGETFRPFKNGIPGPSIYWLCLKAFAEHAELEFNQYD